MNYEMQQALDRKADTWQLHAAQQSIQSLERENACLKENIGRLESSLKNNYSAVESLINILIEKEIFFEEVNALVQIKQYL